MSTTDEIKVPFFKKGKARPTTSRKRSISPPSGSSVLAVSPSSATKTAVVLPVRKTTGNILSTGTKRTAAQRRKDEATLDNASYDYDNSASREGPDVKWTSAGSHIHAAMEIIAGDEAEEMALKRQKKEKQEEKGSDDEAPDDGLYRGQKAYRSHIKKSQDVPKAMRVGPQRSTSTIRTATIVDYQPDVCKDYKGTGYCGFGDTCKFLHDRGTYLAGWQLDRLAENPKGRADESESESDSEDVPFACLICRKHFTDPVVTRCGHYYCSACAIKRYAKTPKCLACGAPTSGIFNRADKILAKANKKRGGDGEREDAETDKASTVKIEGLAEVDDNGDGESDDPGHDG
ncbi:hypothetical protein EDD15DRAFT_1440051 [Pisolithus albus]|nr:hypothetical protein EDD15DRAFT_1440051 [Pisolithus albus]